MKAIVGIPIVIALVAAMVVVRGKRVRQKESAPLVPEVPVAVRTVPVDTGKVVLTRHVLGAVVGAEESDLAAQVMARVIEIKVREGDRVQAGETLVRLDDREFQDAATEAEAALAAAEKSYAAQREITVRDKQLFEAKAIAQEQWDRSVAAEAAAAAQLESARQRLSLARTRLSYCRLAAPADSLVARRLADPGDLAIPGKPLLKLVRQQSVRVRAALPSEDYSALRVGLAASLRTDRDVVNALVSRVYPAMGSDHLAGFECDVTNPPPGFVSGTTVAVDLQLSSTEGLVVPVDALLEGEKGAWVFPVDNGTVRPVQVEVLGRSVDKVAIRGNVRIGDHVVVARPSRLMTLGDGTKVVETAGPERTKP